MIELFDKSQCSGCGACHAVCPLGCIEMLRDDEGFIYPNVITEKCVNCGKCDSVCPVPVWRSKQNTKTDIDAFAAFSNDSETVAKSSSGGLFSVLAERVIADGGCVFGAVFDGTDRVKHVCTTSVDGISPMRGAKYIESDLGESFSDIKNLLRSGKKVMFSGTPCQTTGLKAFLGNEYDNLYCVSFICNSVASPYVFGDYLSDIEKRVGSKATEVSFRDKSTGWLNYASSFCVSLENGTFYRETAGEDRFKNALVNRVITRPICSDCPFRKYEREADISLGDFWGIEKTYPLLSRSDGVSLVLIHSEKGTELFNSVKDKITASPVSSEKALSYNSAFSVQSPPHSSRKMFWSMYGKKNVTELLCDCFDASMVNKLKRFIFSRKG